MFIYFPPEDQPETYTEEFLYRECSSPENFLDPSTFSIEKIEPEDEEAVREDDLKECKREVEPTGYGSEVESTLPVHMEDNRSNEDRGRLVTSISQAAGTGSRMLCTNKQEASCGNETGTRYLRHKCGICKKTFAHLQELKKHKHVNKSNLLHSCSVCHKIFTQSGNLKRHFRLHTGERPFICGICNKAFADGSALKYHSRLHTGERPYVCGICNKTFKQSSTLKNHLRLHTGERPYSCGICNKSFVQCTHLKRHFQSHTGERSNAVAFTGRHSGKVVT